MLSPFCSITTKLPGSFMFSQLSWYPSWGQTRWHMRSQDLAELGGWILCNKVCFPQVVRAWHDEVWSSERYSHEIRCLFIYTEYRITNQQIYGSDSSSRGRTGGSENNNAWGDHHHCHLLCLQPFTVVDFHVLSHLILATSLSPR